MNTDITTTPMPIVCSTVIITQRLQYLDFILGQADDCSQRQENRF